MLNVKLVVAMLIKHRGMLIIICVYIYAGR